ncbi:MAG: 3-oxoadipate enol-lactonase 2 [Chlamydiia bacterium]|nr:3-oxoadipate enol-lactonase 2 [Chlamydiia bacterium]
MAEIQLSSGTFGYEKRGEGPAILCIPGLGRDFSSARRLTDHLIDQFTCVSIDSRGTGVTQAVDEPFTIGDMAKDCVELMEALKIPKYSIAGLSLGSAIAQTALDIAPEHIEKAILITPFPKPTAFSEYASLQSINLLKAGVPEAIVYKALAFLFRDPRKFEEDMAKEKSGAFEEKAKTANQGTLVGLERQCAALRGFDVKKLEKRSDVPALVIAGALDIICPIDKALELKERYQNFSLEVLDASHSVLSEEPELVALAVKKFLYPPEE